jgi:transporter family protein
MNWLAYSLVTIICWGVMGFITKLAYKYYNWQQVFFAASIVTAAISLLTFVSAKPSTNIHFLGFGYMSLIGLTNALGWIALYLALEVGKAIIVVPLSALYPIITIILAYLILHEEISLLKGAGISLALLAILLISID